MASQGHSNGVTISPELEKVVLEFHKVGVFKIGNFQLKSGGMSPIYVDLREIISFPSLLKIASSLVASTIYSKDAIAHDVICGVPYAALPIATLIACDNDTPMVMRRKEMKAHGMKKMVEGRIEPGNKCIIIDDVCTSGESIIETVKDLRDVGLVVTDAVVLLDRQATGPVNLAQHGIKLHSALNLTQMMTVLVKAGLLEASVMEEAELQNKRKRELANGDGGALPVGASWKTMHFAERRALSKNEIAQRLYQIMLDKETNLAVAADLTSAAAVLALAESIGRDICVLKIHVDIIADFTTDFTGRLRQIAARLNFLIMEDRKFSDIGFTVSQQLSGGVYKIADWADLVTLQTLPGPGIVHGLKKGMQSASRNLGYVVVTDMSSAGALTGPDYVAGSLKIAQQNPEDVVAFVTQTDLSADPAFLRMTPGVHIATAGDALGQQYHTPEDVVGRCADIVIVGRGITGAPDPAVAAASYKSRSFTAYRRRVEKL